MFLMTSYSGSKAYMEVSSETSDKAWLAMEYEPRKVDCSRLGCWSASGIVSTKREPMHVFSRFQFFYILEV